MAKSERTIEDIRSDLSAERERVLEALGRLGNDVDDIRSDLQRKMTRAGRRAALLASAAAAVYGTYVALRRRRRKRAANGAAEEEQRGAAASAGPSHRSRPGPRRPDVPQLSAG